MFSNKNIIRLAKPGEFLGYATGRQAFDEVNNVKFIEVKTTKGSAGTSFFISPNELEFSKQHTENYFLYRLYEYQIETVSSKVYILEGNLSEQIIVTPTQFKAQLI
jgi:hypothetical protein